MRDTIDMAREAGLIKTVDCCGVPDKFCGQDEWKGNIKAFESLVRADEREACEALYQHEDVQAPVGNSAWGEAYQDGWIAGAQAYRDAIRARGNT